MNVEAIVQARIDAIRQAWISEAQEWRSLAEDAAAALGTTLPDDVLKDGEDHETDPHYWRNVACDMVDKYLIAALQAELPTRECDERDVVNSMSTIAMSLTGAIDIKTVVAEFVRCVMEEAKRGGVVAWIPQNHTGRIPRMTNLDLAFDAVRSRRIEMTCRLVLFRADGSCFKPA